MLALVRLVGKQVRSVTWVTISPVLVSRDSARSALPLTLAVPIQRVDSGSRTNPFPSCTLVSTPDVQPYAQHRATRIDELHGKTKGRTGGVVGSQRFFCLGVQPIQNVSGKFDAGAAPGMDRFRESQIEQRLTARPPRAAAFKQDSTAALRQLDLRRRRPWLPAEPLPVRRDERWPHGSCTVPVALRMCGRSFGRRPAAFVKSFGSWPKVRRLVRAIVLNCAALGGPLLTTCNPYPRE
jgi:hypothetical protein